MTDTRHGDEPPVAQRDGRARAALEQQLDTLKLQLRYSSTPARRSRLMADINQLRQRLSAIPCD